MKQIEYENPGAAERLARLAAEAEANAERIRRQSVGFPRIAVRVKPSRIVLYREAMNDPDAKEYNEDGFPAFRSLNDVREFAAKKRDRGRNLQVDPDGGVPGSKELRVEAEARRSRTEVRRKRNKKKETLHERLARAVGRTE